MELVASSRISTGGSAIAAPGNSQKLPLSLAQVRPVAGKDGVISVGQTADKSVGIGQLRCRPHFLIRGVQFTVTDILRHGSGKQVGILQHNAQRVPQIRIFLILLMLMPS